MDSKQLTLMDYYSINEATADIIDIPVKESYPECDFCNLFNSCSFEEVHNKHSMTILGNSLDVLAQMKEKTVNLIFADAPYGIGKDFGNDSDKWENAESYANWCKQWIDECMRVLADDGTMYLMTATQHMPYLDIYVAEKYNVLCRIVWTYDSSGVQSKRMYG